MIYYRNTVRGSGLVAHKVKAAARALLDAVGEPNSTLSVLLVHDREIQDLNRSHRGLDKATDVLSFPLWNPGEPRNAEHVERLLGDVVISVDMAARQAAAYDASLQDEISRLLIHGLLHVMGYDHEKTEERQRMQAEERRLAAAIGMRWPFDD